MMLSGSHETDGTLELEGNCGAGWRWQATLDASDAESLQVQLDNVFPAEPATADISYGPNPLMVMHTRRA